MNTLVRLVQSLIGAAIATFFLLVGIGLFWLSFPPSEFGAYVTLFISTTFIIVGTLGVLAASKGSVRGGNTARNRLNR